VIAGYDPSRLQPPGSEPIGPDPQAAPPNRRPPGVADDEHGQARPGPMPPRIELPTGPMAGRPIAGGPVPDGFVLGGAAAVPGGAADVPGGSAAVSAPGGSAAVSAPGGAAAVPAPPWAWDQPAPTAHHLAGPASSGPPAAQPGVAQPAPAQPAPASAGFGAAAVSPPAPAGFAPPAVAGQRPVSGPAQAASAYGHLPVSGPPPAYPMSQAGPMPQAGSHPQFAPQSAPPFGPVSVPGPPDTSRRRRSWPGVTAFLLALALAAVAGFQAYQINQLSDRIGDANRRLDEAQSGDGSRFESLEGRANELEKQAGSVFNPEAISTAVLPSVFRVAAGEFTGTAFAVGKPAAGGGTNLFTNFHVVETVWDGGGRKVFLERTDQRFPATIVKVDKENDIAQLKTDGKFAGLVTATTPVKSGQQIVVVGAPLGLEDSVTTGVVSAFRKSDDGSGTVIQFDAPINPGNSGGPVINGAKQVVGIATAKARDAEGIGLAVPIKTACDQFKIC
jgi:putative serine protease PepD